MRSGTLNVPGIVGFGAARASSPARWRRAARLLGLRERLREGITRQLDEVYLNGHPMHRLPGNLNLSFAYVEGESLLMGLNDRRGVVGSACTSATLEPSYVLKALGVGDELAHTSIRFGLGRFNTEDEVDYVVERVVHEVRRLRDLSPLYEMAKGGICACVECPRRRARKRPIAKAEQRHHGIQRQGTRSLREPPQRRWFRHRGRTRRGTGIVGAPECGDVMKLQLKISDDGVVEDAQFKTFGCGSAIASSSYVTELVKGKTVDEALESRTRTSWRSCRCRRSRSTARCWPRSDQGGDRDWIGASAEREDRRWRSSLDRQRSCARSRVSVETTPTKGLRVKVVGGGCSGLQYKMDLDEERDGDKVFERDGAKLLVDRKSFLYLNGTELDYDEELMTSGFKLRNPNVKRSCGCGSSFIV